jgi:hypothetical protein
MKKWFFLSIIYLLSVHYSFATEGIYKTLQIKSNVSQTKISKLQKDADFNFVVSTIITSIVENESSLQESSQSQSSTFKNNPNNFSLFLKITEEIYSSTFSQYTTAFYNFLIKYRKTDLIYPFHYFW